MLTCRPRFSPCPRGGNCNWGREPISWQSAPVSNSFNSFRPGVLAGKMTPCGYRGSELFGRWATPLPVPRPPRCSPACAPTKTPRSPARFTTATPNWWRFSPASIRMPTPPQSWLPNRCSNCCGSWPPASGRGRCGPISSASRSTSAWPPAGSGPVGPLPLTRRPSPRSRPVEPEPAAQPPIQWTRYVLATDQAGRYMFKPVRPGGTP